ncbi:ribosome recycling factor [Candidatus Berkiella cookevillensis]|uniref:Ribosome-recycling factor n=1 Tax=Candidatus Berkiella cookevillensis TaxID=437022 RepID=A0A0Q9YTY3_9GAMM|nr:ribosome recycling factor [Candidatus Berkiella cookevillensis]MCS5708358.1 ribosome recycling factor [Candidatus Berkiella cookevillensis]
MINDIQKDAKTRMTKSIEGFEHDLSKIRAGRAHPSLLDNIMVPYYGNDTPLSQVAGVHVEGALMLMVKPWEKNMLQAIEKAIRISDLGLNPATSGDVIRVPLPPLSEERRKELIKKVKAEGEQAKVAIRNIRRDSNNHIKESLKKKLISEDEQKRAEDAMQKLTDSYIEKIDQILTRKEKDLIDM